MGDRKKRSRSPFFDGASPYASVVMRSLYSSTLVPDPSVPSSFLSPHQRLLKRLCVGRKVSGTTNRKAGGRGSSSGTGDTGDCEADIEADVGSALRSRKCSVAGNHLLHNVMYSSPGSLPFHMSLSVLSSLPPSVNLSLVSWQMLYVVAPAADVRGACKLIKDLYGDVYILMNLPKVRDIVKHVTGNCANDKGNGKTSKISEAERRRDMPVKCSNLHTLSCLIASCMTSPVGANYVLSNRQPVTAGLLECVCMAVGYVHEHNIWPQTKGAASSFSSSAAAAAAQALALSSTKSPSANRGGHSKQQARDLHRDLVNLTRSFEIDCDASSSCASSSSCGAASDYSYMAYSNGGVLPPPASSLSHALGATARDQHQEEGHENEDDYYDYAAAAGAGYGGGGGGGGGYGGGGYYGGGYDGGSGGAGAYGGPPASHATSSYQEYPYRDAAPLANSGGGRSAQAEQHKSVSSGGGGGGGGKKKKKKNPPPPSAPSTSWFPPYTSMSTKSSPVTDKVTLIAGWWRLLCLIAVDKNPEDYGGGAASDAQRSSDRKSKARRDRDVRGSDSLLRYGAPSSTAPPSPPSENSSVVSSREGDDDGDMVSDSLASESLPHSSSSANKRATVNQIVALEVDNHVLISTASITGKTTEKQRRERERRGRANYSDLVTR